MQMSQLKPASQLARRYGVKSVVFGSPGSGKTPLINTAPRPVLLVTEPGMLSMRGSNVPAWEAYSPALITEFFEWFMKSREAANFDTLGIDSISNIAEIILAEELKSLKFFTVESIANASDAMITKLGMIAGKSPYAFREDAQRFLKLASDDAEVSRMEEKTKSLEAQVAEMKAMLESLTNPKDETKKGK